jgi:hypothetical protein
MKQSSFYLIVPSVLEIFSNCNQFYNYPYVLLGIGDIVIPALHINYAVLYDIKSSRKFLLYTAINFTGKYK